MYFQTSSTQGRDSDSEPEIMTAAEFLPNPFIYLLIFLMVSGSLLNILVFYVVASHKALRTPRHLFIVNLAAADLLLCSFTQPFNLYRLIDPSWPFGEIMCKLVALIQAVSVFASTFSVTAIAVERLNVRFRYFL